MGGCLRRLGCLFLLLILACAAWLTRGVWLPDRFRPHHATSSVGWERANSASATRAQGAVSRLGQVGGPSSVTMSAGEFVSFIQREVASRLEGKVDSVSARVDDELISFRARVDFSRMRGALGTAGLLLREDEPVELTGRPRILKPGLAEFEVVDATVGRITLPRAVVPRLIRAIDRGRRPAEVHGGAFPLPMPTSVSDIRVANGKVTLYKNAK